MKRTKYKMYVLLLLIILPYLAIILTIMEENPVFSPLFSVRRLGIMGKTLGFSIVVGIIGVIVSWIIGYYLNRIFKGKLWISAILIALAVMPSFMQAYLWMNTMYVVFDRVALSGFWISAFVQLIYLLPIGILMWYHVFAMFDDEYFYEAYINTAIKTGYTRVVYELSKGPGTILLILYILLSMTDYTIPSVFAFNTYPIEIMTVFAGTLNIYEPVFVSIPMILITTILVSIIIKKNNSKLEGTSGVSSIIVKTCSKDYIILLIIIVLMFIPFILMIVDSLTSTNIVELISNYSEDYIFTLVSSITGAVVVLLISYNLNLYILDNRKLKRTMILVMIVLLGIPGTVTGITINNFYSELSNLSPILTELRNSFLPLSHVNVLRFLPIGYFLMAFGFEYMPIEYVEQAKLDTNNLLVMLKHGVFNRLKPYLITTFFIVVILSFSELSGAIMVVPPGRSTITVTIYNYLHYGSTDVVATLCMTFMLLIVLATLITYKLIKKKSKKRIINILIVGIIVTSFSGCRQINDTTNVIQSLDYTLDVMTMEVYNGKIYLGTTDGLYYIDEERLIKVPLVVTTTLIHDLYVNHNQELLVGSMEGLIVIDGDNQIYYGKDSFLPDIRINVIAEDTSGNIYIGTWNGLVVVDQEFEVIEKDIKLLSSMVNIIDFDSLDNIIIGSYNVRDGGLTILYENLPDEYIEKSYDGSSQLTTINFTGIVVKEDLFLVGGGMYEKGGFDKFEYKEGTYFLTKSYKQEDGLAGPKIRSMYSLGNTLIVGSEYDGLSIMKFDDEFSEVIDSRILTSKDGLAHNEIKCIIEYEGWLYFGTKAGISKIIIENEWR